MFGRNKREEYKEQLLFETKNYRNCLQAFSIYAKNAQECLKKHDDKKSYCSGELGKRAQVQEECNIHKENVNRLMNRAFPSPGRSSSG